MADVATSNDYTDLDNIPLYTISVTTTTEGYAKSYALVDTTTEDGTLGVTIDIPESVSIFETMNDDFNSIK